MKLKQSQNIIKCHLCGSDDIMSFPEYSNLLRVTSDCKPWKRYGNLCLCQKCYAVQKKIEPSFFKESGIIYSNYDAYHQAQGLDQVTFTQKNFNVTGRSETILNSVLEKLEIPSKGFFLDIGCGKGNMLKVFSKKLPDWQLYGFDLNENRRVEIESIQNVSKYYTRDLSSINDNFELISMIHVLEHIPQPYQYLSEIKNLLTDNGFLIIEVPDLLENPFDLLIADHTTHFTMNRLRRLLNDTGFEVLLLSKNVISKELTTVVRKSRKDFSCDSRLNKQEKNIDTYIDESINWLNWIKNKVKELGYKDRIGLFGAGIASAWLIGESPEKIGFCVDEDAHKINKKYFGKPVLDPSSVKSKKIFIPMPYLISQKISKRWSGINDNIYYTTPEFVWRGLN